jgi:hypothetical protein
MEIVVPSANPLVPQFNEKVSFFWANKLLTNRVVYHVLFWFFIFGFSAAYISVIDEDRFVSLYNLVLRIPFIIACCYLNLYVLLPRFYFRNLLIRYAVVVMGLIFTLNALNLFFLEVFVESPICPSTFEADATFNSSNYLYKSFYLFSLVGLTSGIKLSKSHYIERQKADAIEKEKLQTELTLLKSQIQPHFFFNTLNNLYALTLKKSELAPEMILKLSDLMSYGLYEAEAASVPLEKEIEHIRNYVELESLRLGSRATVQFEVNGNTAGKRIPPLIFMPFIENCFKHSALHGANSSIDIRIDMKLDFIKLRTANPVHSTTKPVLEKKGGLGLKNIHRRLQLLYGTKYQVETRLSGDVYNVVIHIPLI